MFVVKLGVPIQEPSRWSDCENGVAILIYFYISSHTERLYSATERERHMLELEYLLS